MLTAQQVARATATRLASSQADVAYFPDDPIAWIETEFYIPETGQAIVLEQYQRAVIREALRRDDGGLFIYSLVLWSDLKKSAKSTIAAAVCLFLAWHHSWETVRVVGNDLKQANSRTFYYIERAIKLNPRLRARCQVKNYHITLPNETVIEAIAVDPKGEAGGGDLIVCFTELWAAKNHAAQQLWSETTLSPLKYGKSLRWCESYAGFTGESPILEQLYEQGVKEGHAVDVGIDGLELTANDAARMLCLWNTVPRCDWQTTEYYAQEAGSLTPNEFARLHRNEWASSVDSFIPIEWWDARQAVLPPLRDRQPIVVGIDAAVSGDCFAIVGVSRTSEQVHVRFARAWTPPKDAKILYSDPNDPTRMDTPEGYCRWIVANYNVAVWAYDPYQLEDFTQRLGRQGLGFFEAFNQGSDRLVADKQLYDCILNGLIVHDGNSDLREHIQNANQKAEGDKLRIIKRVQHGKPIDLAVALSMCNARVRFYNVG